MKIVYLHQYFNTLAMSGSTRSYETARRLADRGHEVHIVTMAQDRRFGASIRQEEMDGFTVHWLPIRYDNAMGNRHRLLAWAAYAVAAAVHAARLRADVVFASSTPLTMAVPAVMLKRIYRAPLVFEVRDVWPDVPISTGELGERAGRWALRLERWAYTHSDRIIALSPGMVAAIVAKGVPEDKVICVPNAADIDLFSKVSDHGRAFRLTRDWLGDRPLVVYAGTIGRLNLDRSVATVDRRHLEDKFRGRLRTVAQRRPMRSSATSRS